MTTAYIISSVRTAVGKAPSGTLRNIHPADLGATPVRAAIDRVTGLDPQIIDDLIIGCTTPESAQGGNLGRMIAQRANLPDQVPGCTVNRCCASGLQTIAMANQAIIAGQAEIIVAGGTESMSLVPISHSVGDANPEMIDHKPSIYLNMGITAENVAQKYNISRIQQDEFAFQSHQRAIAAIQAGKFQEEIVPFMFKETLYKDGETYAVEKVFETDECPRANTTLAVIGSLRPVFRANGTVTAGNSSQTSDGAAAVVVMSEQKVKELGLQPMARLLGYTVAGVPPEIMGIGPIVAIPKVLQQVGLEIKDIGLFELNEAFAAPAVACIRELELNQAIVNVNGGAIALGHPLGCTGAKLTVTLLYEMKRRGIRYGICSMCIGGGMGAAGVFENLML